jgi:tRNA(Ile)-lysidine synthase
VLLERIRATMERHGMVRAHSRVGVAVSGGADSICLLQLLYRLARERDLSLAVLHLNHLLRGEESEADAQFVAREAEKLSLPFTRRDVDVRAAGGNLEEEARRARLEFFNDAKRDLELERIATGHTLSDQAETVLFRLMRGAGTAGLRGILPVTRDGLIRPLIDISRDEIEHWLREQGIAWREDASNRDIAYTRNRIRHELLPHLTAEYNPRLPETLARLADLAREDEAEWERQVAALAAEHLVVRPPAILVQASAIVSLAPALARRLLRHAAEQVRGDLIGLDFEHIETIHGLAAREDGHGRAILPRLDVMRSFDWLRLAPPACRPPERFLETAVTGPGVYGLAPGEPELDLQVMPVEQVTEKNRNGGQSPYNEDSSTLDWDRLEGGLVLRNWRPGDAYCPAGQRSMERVKILFQRAKVPFWDRRNWPMLTWKGEIVWSRRFGAAESFQPGAKTRMVLRVSELQHSAPKASNSALK